MSKAKERYCLKVDIDKCFCRIDPATTTKIVDREIEDSRVAEIIKGVVALPRKRIGGKR